MEADGAVGLGRGESLMARVSKYLFIIYAGVVVTLMIVGMAS